ncbi:MAG: adenylosuccinate synthetase [Pseudomonadota bacterium]
MPVTVVVGGQYGSEGKGKVAALFAKKLGAEAVIRCGGSNSGHTVYDDSGRKFIFRQLPTACLQTAVVNILVAGSYIDVDVLLSEIALVDVETERLCIDPYAVIITNDHKQEESDSGLNIRLGSTGSGTGAAVKQRLLRSKDIIFAKNVPDLAPFIRDSKELINELLLTNKRIIIEGTQGYGLSVLHSREYPYVTTRDTTAAGFISEAGISPLYVDDIVLVIRAFPIRVSGNSGPLLRELTWEELTIESGKEITAELTSVTNRQRRIAHFDEKIVINAINANVPTTLVINHVDYIRDSLRDEFINDIESKIKRQIDWIGDNPFSMKRRNQNAYSVVGV